MVVSGLQETYKAIIIIIYLHTIRTPIEYFVLQVNTFQTVLATDGSATYVMFLYRDIQGSINTKVGFNAGDGIRSFNLLESSTNEGGLDTTSNVGPECAGVYFFRVDGQNIMEPPGMYM